MSKITSKTPIGEQFCAADSTTAQSPTDKRNLMPQSMERRYSAYPIVPKTVISRELGISGSTLKNWRLGRVNSDGTRTLPKLVENIHWFAIGQRKILYNFELIRDYVHNIKQPQLHERAIDAYLASLPSSKAAEIYEGGRNHG